jgi:hypothetical protein
VAAIDALAAELPGDPQYFWSIGAGATEDQRQMIKEREARERRGAAMEKI